MTSQIKYVDLFLAVFNYQPKQLEENTYFKTMKYYTAVNPTLFVFLHHNGFPYKNQSYSKEIFKRSAQAMDLIKKKVKTTKPA